MVKKIHILKDGRGLGVQISMKLNHVTGEKGVFVSDVSPGGAAERLAINNSFLKVKVSLSSSSVMHLFFKVCFFLKKTIKMYQKFDTIERRSQYIMLPW